MKKKKIFGGVLLFMLAVFVIGDIYDRYPHAKDVKDLPKGKPVIVLSFQGAPPDELKYMSVSLTYTASEAVPAAAYARHADSTKNVLASTRPGTFDVVGKATVIPYKGDEAPVSVHFFG